MGVRRRGNLGQGKSAWLASVIDPQSMLRTLSTRRPLSFRIPQSRVLEKKKTIGLPKSRSAA